LDNPQRTSKGLYGFPTKSVQRLKELKMIIVGFKVDTRVLNNNSKTFSKKDIKTNYNDALTFLNTIIKN
jgi:hypothetical protein